MAAPFEGHEPSREHSRDLNEADRVWVVLDGRREGRRPSMRDQLRAQEPPR